MRLYPGITFPAYCEGCSLFVYDWTVFFQLRNVVGANVQIDALEPSERSSEIARRKKIYTYFYKEFLEGIGSTTLPSGMWD